MYLNFCYQVNKNLAKFAFLEVGPCDPFRNAARIGILMNIFVICFYWNLRL
jgi:hypothetical protein